MGRFIKKGKAFVVLSIAILFFTDVINAQIQQNGSATKITLTDSSLTNWVAQSVLSNEFYYNNFKSDTVGNIYCVAEQKKDISKRQLFKLANDQVDGWKVFETGIENKNYMSLHDDGQGNLYVKSDDGLYRLGDNKWDKVFSWYKGVTSSIPFPKSDGGLYARITDWKSTSKNTTIVKIENGVTQHLGKGGKPLELLDFDDWFVVGRDGTIYSYYSHPSHIASKIKTTTVYRWNGNKWEKTGTLPAKITYIDFDRNNILYAAGSNSQADWFFKKWDGSKWSDVTLPEGLNKGTSYHPIFDEKKNVYVVGKKEINKVLYKLVNGQWVEQVRDGVDLKFFASNYFPSNGYVYATGNALGMNTQSEYIYRHEQAQWVITNKEVEKVPMMVASLNPSDARYLSNFYIYEENGLKGIVNTRGHRIIKPIFNEIILIYNPKNLCTNQSYSSKVSLYEADYVLKMTKGSDIIYAEFPFKNTILNQFIKSTCPTCNGSGSEGGGERTREIKGEYVKEEVTQVKKLQINGYVMETTTTPGYYKESKFVKEKVPVKTCSQCNGHKKILIYDDSYDNVTRKKYLQIWGR